MKTENLLTQNSVGGLPNGVNLALVLNHDPASAPSLRHFPDRLPHQELARATSIRAGERPVSIALCLASALRNRWVLYLGRREQFEKSPSEEAVHELRVATRRLMAQLDLLAALLSSRAAEKACRALKRSMKALGRLRDVQVQRLFVEERLEAFPELILLWHDFKEREHARAASAASKVSTLKIYKFEKWISLIFQDLAEKTHNLRLEQQLSAAVLRVFQKTYAEVVKRRRAIRKQDSETIHKTRVAFKKFRYMIEALSPGFTGFDERQLGALAAYQRHMGMIQDIEILQATLTAFTEKFPAAREFLHRYVRGLAQRRARAMDSFMKQADRIFEFSPPRSGI